MAALPRSMELCFAARAGTCQRAPTSIPKKRRAGGSTVRCVATAPMGEKAEYRDGPLERAFMGLFARKMEKYATKKKQPQLEQPEKKALTVPFFRWLVGPSEVIEVEVNGVRQRSGVLIKKYRYLENSGCVGMCVNMCKIPTQDFFTNEFGLPLTMNPNFEDMRCEMIYGQVPPPLEEDPVSKQPCYPNLCCMPTPSAPVCAKLQA